MARRVFLMSSFNNQTAAGVTDPCDLQSAGDNGAADTSVAFGIPGWSGLRACQDTAALFCQDFKGAIPTMIPIYK